MRKQRKVSVRMRCTLYFLGVKESHFVWSSFGKQMLRKCELTSNEHMISLLWLYVLALSPQN